MAAITALHIFKEKGKPGIPVESALFVENLGMEGDRYARGGERQVTLLPAEVLGWMREQQEPGLCFKRYKANLESEGFSAEGLSSGSELFIGQAVFRVSEISKECFPECRLLSSGRECRLAGAGMFLQVVKSGTVRVGDRVEVKNKKSAF